MKWEIENKVKEFVKKYNNGELAIDPSKFGHYVANDYGVNPLYTQLAEAVHNFEISEQKDYDYNDNTEKLNKMISLAIGHGIIKDTTITKQIETLEEKNKLTETQLQEANKKIELLIEEKGILKGKIEMYERDMPQPDTFIGDIDE